MEQISFVVCNKEELIEIIEKIVEKKINEKISSIQSSKLNTLPEILTVKKVSELLEVSEDTLRNWRNNGILNGKKIGTRVYYMRNDILKRVE